MGAFESGLQVTFSLIVIIVIAVVGIRFLGRKSTGFGTHPLFRVVHAQTLGANKSVYAMVIDEKTVLLIGAGSTIETLAQFDDPEFAHKLLQPTRPGWQPGGWANQVARVITSNRGRPRKDDSRSDFAGIVRERMREMSNQRARALSELARDQDGKSSSRKDSQEQRWSP